MRASLRLCLYALLGLVLAAGCQRAGRYGRSAPEPSPSSAASAAVEAPGPDMQWVDVGPEPPKPDVVITFVHAETSPKEWQALTKFWTEPPLGKPAEAAALIGLPPLAAGSLVGRGTTPAVKVKVPLGLPDPTKYMPADNPPTLGKWNLGRRLFYDDAYLADKTGTSCAGCHRPDHGFADFERTHPDSYNTPMLVNCVFNSHQFWDGRAGRLEEVVQRTLEDERATPAANKFRHVWGGVIRRLRANDSYVWQFNQVFGRPEGRDDLSRPLSSVTQDNIGRALATYLRALLAGDSLHDRALQARGPGRDLLAEHYEKVLTDDALRALGQEKAKKTDVAAQLFRGYQLFHDLDPKRPTHCAHCHSGPTFTDHAFHNLGIGYTSRIGEEAGRFATVPVGQKNRYLIDAFKTPTLRGLLRTRPYFHDGSKASLREVVELYNQGAGRNPYLDPELRGKNDEPRLLGLQEADIDALVLFLGALNGGDVDAAVKAPR